MSILSYPFNPKLFLPQKHVFLLSHMRARTSVLSHVIGSNEQIRGYYECHISYYSWKSLVKHQLKFHKEHANVSVAKFYFDKVLHNHHHIADQVLTSDNCQFIFMLRKPADTIRSIMKLHGSDNPLSEIAGATKYYVSRLNELEQLSKKIAPKQMLYIDADALVDNTERSLEILTSWVGLKQPLTPSYKSFKHTGKGHYGDNSASLTSGSIIETKPENTIELDENYLTLAQNKYEQVKNELIQKSTIAI
ncbi:sulfotransferase [Thalassotalea agariperforans]